MSEELIIALIGVGSTLLVVYLTAHFSERSRTQEQKAKLLELFGQIEHQLDQAGVETDDLEHVIRAVNEEEQEGPLAIAIGVMSSRLTEVTKLVSEIKLQEAELKEMQGEERRLEAERESLEAERVRLHTLRQVAKDYGAELMEQLEDIPPATTQEAVKRGKLRLTWEKIVAQINQYQAENEDASTQADVQQEDEDQ